MKLLIIFLLIYGVLAFFILRTKKVHKNTSLIMTLIAGFLVLSNLLPIIIYQLKLQRSDQNIQPSPQEISPVANKDKPDIYYIVLDAYSREDILKEVIGYDNSAFISALKSRGFYVPDCAFSNYDITLATISTVLNYNYHTPLGIPDNNVGEDSVDNLNLILNNKARIYFKGFGYRFVAGRGYSSFNDINDADVYLNYFSDENGKNEMAEKKFISLYLNTTIVRFLTEIYKNNPENFSRFPFWIALDRGTNAELAESSFWYYQNNYMLDSLETIPAMDGNYLVYAHINSPHLPYVYRSDGSFRYPLDTHDEKVLYADTLTYLNKRVLQVVDSILSTSTIPPIIIIQGDHGIHNLTNGLNKHKILSAYYLPGALNTPPYLTITPVNNFRLIIRNYFDPEMPMLPDNLYVKYLNNHEFIPSSCDLQP